MKEKYCPRCEKTKPSIDFYTRNASLDRLDTYCKVCRNTDFRHPASKLEDTEDTDTKIGAEIVLRALGYELYNPDNPVYLQFKRRLEQKGIHISKW